MRRTVRDLAIVVSVCAVAVAVPIVVNHTVGRGGVQVHGPVVSYEIPWFHLGGYAGLDALISGRLELTGSCLLLSGQAVVWPSRTRWDAEDQVLKLPHGGRAHLGDRVSGGGGFVGGRGDRAWATTEAGRALAPCHAPDTDVAVFNIAEELDVGSGTFR